MAEDRPRQPAYEIFSTQRRFQQISDPQAQGGRRTRALKTATP